MHKYHKWTEADDLLIKELLSQNKTIREISTAFPDLSLYSIKNRVRKLSGRSKESTLWNESNLSILKEKAPSLTVKELAELLNIKESTVYSKLSLLNITPKILTKDWTEAEDVFLKENYCKKTFSRIGQKLGRTSSSVQQRATKLGLKKTSVKWTKRKH